jgi:glycosyltransferase involved in cell wall biosynthesis
MYYNRAAAKILYSNISLRNKLSGNFARSLEHILSTDPPDLIHAVDNITVDWCLPVGEKLDIPTVVDLHNVAAEELVASGTIKRNASEFTRLQQANREHFARVNGILAVSDEMKTYLIKNYDVEDNHIAVVPHGGRLRPVKSFKLSSPSLIFSGLLTLRDHVDLFVQSMPFVSEAVPKAKFYITRKGEMLQKLAKMADGLGVDPMFVWIKNDNDFYSFLSSCNVGVLTSRIDIPNVIGPPIKLWDYMSVGLPIVANDVGCWSKMISKYKIGVITDDSPKSFAEGLLMLLTDEELRIQCGLNQLRLIEGPMNWDNSIRTMINFYEKLAD